MPRTDPMTMRAALLSIEATLPPDPRSTAILASLREACALPVADAGPTPWTAGDVNADALKFALHFLSHRRPGDDERTTARRKTCFEIGDAIKRSSQVWTVEELARMALPWFTAQVAAWTGATDPRHAAMAATAEREAAELRALLG